MTTPVVGSKWYWTKFSGETMFYTIKEVDDKGRIWVDPLTPSDTPGWFTQSSIDQGDFKPVEDEQSLEQEFEVEF